MPAKTRTKRAHNKKNYRVLRNFTYPASQAVRERGISQTPQAEQGEWVRHVVGDKIATLPTDVLRNLLMRGAVELIKKGASDDSPR